MIILASSSPRRQELLKKITSDFIIDVPNVDETSDQDILSKATEIALKKAIAIQKKHPNDVIIACDTIVVLDDKILGKPKDNDDAIKMLKELSNRTHLVVTGYALIDSQETITGKDMTYVTFNKLSDKKIKEYVSTGSPLDKAGAYGIQDNQFNLVKSIDGSYYNVMGFPLEIFAKLLKNRL